MKNRNCIELTIRTFVYALLLSACSTSTYRFQSSPAEANITFISASGAKKGIGKTPLTVPAQELNPGREAFRIEVEKEGFDAQSMFIADSNFSKNIDATFALTEHKKVFGSQPEEVSLEAVSSAVADIQKDIQTKNYEIALTKLNNMIGQYPRVATFYSLSGNVHYLERRLDKALVNYKKALALNPKLTEVQYMVDRIAQFSGGSR